VTTPDRRPILVTGTHRSGTTWVGRMLTLSRQAHYIHEPFASMYERAWADPPPTTRYLYLRAGQPSTLEADLDRITGLRPPWMHVARRAGGARNALRLSQEALQVAVARRRGARALIKDPFALLLAEWISARSQADVIVLVRHPAAFVSSVKRLGWRARTDHLLGQPDLMADHLEPFRDALERDRRGELDIIDHACVVWCALNTVVASYAQRHPDWCVTRYEDLAEDPVRAFGNLYRWTGQDWTPRVAARIVKENAPRHGSEVADGSGGGTRRHSRGAMWTWLDRLTPEEVARVQAATSDVADHWYGPSSWIPPEQ
jgi:hypothetical protein